MDLPVVLLVDQRRAAAVCTASGYMELPKTMGLLSVVIQGTLLWMCRIRWRTAITRLRDRVMFTAAAKGTTTDKTRALTRSMLRISSGRSLHDRGGRTGQRCGL